MAVINDDVEYIYIYSKSLDKSLPIYWLHSSTSQRYSVDSRGHAAILLCSLSIFVKIVVFNIKSNCIVSRQPYGVFSASHL